jgi:hypothetical protein
MKTLIVRSSRRTFKIALLAVLMMLLAAGTSLAAVDAAKTEAQKATTPTTITTGSGEKYKTTVEQKPGAELSPEDFRQASLLASRIVVHLNDAIEGLNNERSEDARAALEKGLGLVNVVRQLLPTTEVTTVVHDSKGMEVYRHVDQAQNDRIPLFEGLVAVKVVEAIADAKQDAAAVKGVRLADADVIHTSVLVDLNYIEAKLKQAKDALTDKPKDALAHLTLAQSNGIEFSVNKQDDPLVAAQMALQLAEQMVKQDRPEAAKANLQQAKNYLVMYRGIIGEEKNDEVQKLEADISNLQANIERGGAAGEIREFWDRVVGWFARENRETRATTDTKDQKTGGADRTATKTK